MSLKKTATEKLLPIWLKFWYSITHHQPCLLLLVWFRLFNAVKGYAQTKNTDKWARATGHKCAKHPHRQMKLKIISWKWRWRKSDGRTFHFHITDLHDAAGNNCQRLKHYAPWIHQPRGRSWHNRGPTINGWMHVPDAASWRWDTPNSIAS